ncbi:MAG TPA: lytic transglycosylase domain-containing protein [Methylomirabilota bacterium]|jgi:hypothetical protein|nr:lytic transglycosylase domain-containing protein [Methylomirabilota bacterium]
MRPHNAQHQDTFNDDRPRRRMLGLAVMLLTLTGGYAVAHRDLVLPAVAFVGFTEEAAADEERPVPTTAEIMAHIEEVSARYRVSPRLVAAIVAVESEFNPNAVSRRGAQGLMQLMPATAADLDVQDSFDMRENLEGGVRHLRVLMDRFRNDLPLVLAAYNAGDRAVIAYRDIPPYPQTRRYVIRVLRRYDPAAARAAASRIYGSGATATTAPGAPSAWTRLVSRESSARRPGALGPWRDETTAPTSGPAPPSATESGSAHGADSP